MPDDLPRRDPADDIVDRGTPAWRQHQADRYRDQRGRDRRHVVSCRHCRREITETRQDARAGVCTRCLGQGRV